LEETGSLIWLLFAIYNFPWTQSETTIKRDEL